MANRAHAKRARHEAADEEEEEPHSPVGGVHNHTGEGEEEDEVAGEENTHALPRLNRPRRKATERPETGGQVRQAFSKRKKGLVTKAYQLHKKTDAKVFIFMMNNKGASWAYASPGFGASLAPDHLRSMREAAFDAPNAVTEISAHPAQGDPDDRDQYVGQDAAGTAAVQPIHLEDDGGVLIDEDSQQGWGTHNVVVQGGADAGPAAALHATPSGLPHHLPGSHVHYCDDHHSLEHPVSSSLAADHMEHSHYRTGSPAPDTRHVHSRHMLVAPGTAIGTPVWQLATGQVDIHADQDPQSVSSHEIHNRHDAQHGQLPHLHMPALGLPMHANGHHCYERHIASTSAMQHATE